MRQILISGYLGIAVFGLLGLLCTWRLVVHVRGKSSNGRILLHLLLLIASALRLAHHLVLAFGSWKLSLIFACLAYYMFFVCAVQVVYSWSHTIDACTITRLPSPTLYPLLITVVVQGAISIVYCIRTLVSKQDFAHYIPGPMRRILASTRLISINVLIAIAIINAWRLRKRMVKLQIVQADEKRKSIRILTLSVFSIVAAELLMEVSYVVRFYLTKNRYGLGEALEYDIFTSFIPFAILVPCLLFLTRRVQKRANGTIPGSITTP